MVSVLLPASLVRLFPGAPRRLELDAGTIGAVIDELDRQWPGMRGRLCDAGPAVRPHINIFVDGERSTLATPLKADAEVWIMTAVSGG